MKNIRLFVVIVFGLCGLASVWAATEGGPPAGYYDAINGKKESDLKSILGTFTRARLTTLLDYGSGTNKTWQGLYYTDRNESDNSVIDMYSNVVRYFNPSAPTASVTNCDIEHMFPNSWFGAKAGCKEAYCDLHHLVPADYSANRSKSNRGPGVPTDTTFNNGVWVNGKDGTRDDLLVFCPPDEYKGDFARAFFYIAATYGDTVTWVKEAVPNHMSNDTWEEFLPETRDLLLGWHRMDPVSAKELKRMNEVYKIQGNRNPFIDYPCLAEYLWGTHQGETVVLANLTSPYNDDYVGDGCSCTTDPVIASPTGTIHCGSTKVGVGISTTITVRGLNLTGSGNLTIAKSGVNAGLFSLSTTSISKSNAEAGKDVTITYTPTAIGEHTATLTISGCGVTSHTVTLTGTCVPFYTATWMTGTTTHAYTEVASGSRPALPSTPADCSATRVFVGWTVESSVSSKPADLFKEVAPVMTTNQTFRAVYADASAGSTDAGSEEYIFSSKLWDADPEPWTSGQNGYAYKEGQGVQVSGSVTGANATCPTSYNDIRTVVVNYCTNASSGAGDIVISVGGTTKTNSVTNSSGGTTLRDATFDFTSAPKNGAVKITVNTTGGSIYINSVTINHGTPITYSDYSLLCSAGAPVSVTDTFMNMGTLYEARSGETGETIATVANPTACDGYTFEGWSTSEYSTSNTAAPTIDYTGVFAGTDKTYHAVYSKTESGSGSGGAEAGVTLWAESFTGFAADDVPTSGNSNTTVYGTGSVTYNCVTGSGSANTTKVYAGSSTMYAGGTKPELMITSKNGSFSISGIPTGNASVMTLSFKSNKDTDILAVSSGTSGISVGEVSKSDGILSCDISNTGNSTFSLTITNTNDKTTNARVDDFSLTVKTAAAGSSTTYHTTAPDCCTATLTVESPDDTKGEAGIE